MKLILGRIDKDTNIHFHACAHTLIQLRTRACNMIMMQPLLFPDPLLPITQRLHEIPDVVASSSARPGGRLAKIRLRVLGAARRLLLVGRTSWRSRHRHSLEARSVRRIGRQLFPVREDHKHSVELSLLHGGDNVWVSPALPRNIGLHSNCVGSSTATRPDKAHRGTRR